MNILENTTTSMSELIISTINTLFEMIFSSIDHNIYLILDDITFISPDILSSSKFQAILGTTPTSGLLLVGNSLLIGFLLYYSIKLFLSNFTYVSIDRPYQFIFKIILYAILMNSSFFLCEQILSLNSYLTLAIREIGESLFHKSICFSSLIQDLNSIVSINSASISMFSLEGIVKSFLSIGILNLLLSYSLRYVLVQILVLISPFAFLSLSTVSTSVFFKAWLKLFISSLCLQIFISIVLIFIFSLCLTSNNLFDQLLYLGSIYVLTKANSILRQLIGGISTEISSGIKNIHSFSKGG